MENGKGPRKDSEDLPTLHDLAKTMKGLKSS